IFNFDAAKAKLLHASCSENQKPMVFEVRKTESFSQPPIIFNNWGLRTLSKFLILTQQKLRICMLRVRDMQKT
ncbi:MAG: hypothetical protein ACXVHV_09415, partial [Methanobacterium sp.]